MMAGDQPATRLHIPRTIPDTGEEIITARQQFVREHTGAAIDHVTRYSFDPAGLRGNIEHFIGAAQVPVGVAGPLRVCGEHARGDFLVPLATTEGTLVASYNRGMRVLYECGGVKTTVLEGAMQRAPVFMFADALEAREFGHWVDDHLEEIRAAAEATTHTGRLIGIGQYAVGPLRYLRFNYTTGDAAGQNMTGKATLAACEWIRDHHPIRPGFLLSGNIDTDKKQSQINMLQTRGKRVVAEAVIPAELLHGLTGLGPADLYRMRQISNVGAFMAGAASNGAHAANAIAALFIATGQDVANVAESHAGLTYSYLLPSGDYYWSVTLTSLIVATVGGGTGLPTQRECLEMMDCYGPGKVDKFAEICAGVVLAGEISLSSAVVHGDWVTAHERLGRNRPAEAFVLPQS